jgi:hypothetical protein
VTSEVIDQASAGVNVVGKIGIVDGTDDELAGMPYWNKALRKCLRGLSNAVDDYVYSRHVGYEELRQMLLNQGHINNCLSTADSFKSYVDREGLLDKLRASFCGSPVVRYRSATEWFYSLYALAELNYDESGEYQLSLSIDAPLRARAIAKFLDGRIYFELDEFAQSFHSIPFERIRICEVCRKVFWARRLPSATCAKQCQSILSSRRYRGRLTPEQRQRDKERRALKP